MEAQFVPPAPASIRAPEPPASEPAGSGAAPDWSALLRTQGGHRLSWAVLLGEPGRPVHSEGVDADRVPASVAKLFAAWAALRRLGPDFRWVTAWEWEEIAPGLASSVRLLGSGDPSVGLGELGEAPSDRFRAWARALAARGVREIRGPIELAPSDLRWLDYTARPDRVPSGWSIGDVSECYGVAPQFLNVEVNCALYEVTGARSGRWVHRPAGDRVQVALAAGSATAARARLLSDGVTVRIEGTLRRGDRPRLALPIWDTRPWARAELAAALAIEGVDWDPSSAPVSTLSLASVSTLSHASVVGSPTRRLELRSPRLADVIRPFLKESLNVMGEALLLTLGAQAGGAGDLRELGLEVVREELERTLGAASLTAITLRDGSGLSRENRVSARALHALLAAARAEPAEFEPFREALAVAGVDGTLADRMGGTAAQGRVLGKTGTLATVANLAGYLRSAAGEWLPFIFLAQASTSDDRAAARAAQDRVLSRWALE